MAHDKITVEQAFDGAEIKILELENWDKADGFLERAHELYRTRSHWLPAYERIAILVRLAELVAAESDSFAVLIAREGGKPIRDARIEVDRAIHGIRLAAEEVGRLNGVEIPMDITPSGAGRTAFTRQEPIGPVVAISAFNHPLNLIVHQVAPAIAAGCPVIVKPANTTPLCCLRFVELVHEAGLHPDWCQAIFCDIPTAEKMVTDPRTAFFTFIGSAKVGWYLRSKLAPGTRCALEHGGAAPAIIAADADLETVIPALIKGGFYHAGQVCVSIQRIFVENAIRQEFQDLLVKGVNKLVTSDPLEDETDVGPLIQPREVDRVESWVNEAVSEGGTVLAGGKRINERLYSPTVLLEPGIDARVTRQEIFGPVVCLYGYDEIDSAISRANSLPLAFQSSVFTRDIDRAFGVANRLAGGTAMINDHSAFRVDWMPFGGWRTSGLGVGGIGYTMHDMTQEKLIVVKHG